MRTNEKRKSKAPGAKAENSTLSETERLGHLMQRFLFFVPPDKAYRSLSELFILHVLNTEEENLISHEKMEDLYFMLKLLGEAAEIVNKE